jgi:hypothetical protein
MEQKKILQGFQVVKLHYSADPEKDQAWVERTKPDYPSETWAREFELDPVGHIGNYPVFGDYKKQLHENPNLTYNSANKIIIRGWDFGKVHPCVECIQIDGVKKNVLLEVAGDNIQLEGFIQQVFAACQIHFPGANFIDWVDATGKNEKDSGLPSIKVMRQFGLKPKWRMQAIEEGVTYMAQEISSIANGRPRFQVHPRCKQLCEALRGGYQRNKHGIIIKDGTYDHAVDACRYAISGIITKRNNAETDVEAKLKNYKYKPHNRITGY